MNMRQIFIGVAFIVFAGSAAQAAGGTVHLYVEKKTATNHCPGDTVVSVNQTSGVYHMPGSKDYGKTKSGKYACLADVSKDSEFHAAANGQ